MKRARRAKERERSGRGIEGGVGQYALTCTDIGDTIGIVIGTLSFSVGLLTALGALKVLPTVGHWQQAGDVLTMSMRYSTFYAFFDALPPQVPILWDHYTRPLQSSRRTPLVLNKDEPRCLLLMNRNRSYNSPGF
jgi:hypothetical protein